MQPQMMSLLARAQGTSVIEETIFESRNKHISELIRMGADVLPSKDGKSATIRGVKTLTGAAVAARDLRGGAALIVAGLAAEGQTVVTGSKYVERGYEQIETTLSQLGADITYQP